MSTIQFLSTSPEQLAELINEGVKTQLEAFKKDLHNKEAQDELLTREQAAKLLQIHETKSGSAIKGDTLGVTPKKVRLK